MGSQGWPGRLVGESWNVVVGVVELCDGLWSEELFGRDVEAVGVALNRTMKPRGRVTELAQQCVGRAVKIVAVGFAAGSQSRCAV